MPALKYETSLCKKVIELGKEGKTHAQISRDLNIGPRTFYDWVERYPEFKEAVEIAKFYEMAWWEDLLQRKLAASESINGYIWARRMAARFKDYYSNASMNEENKIVVEVKSFNGSEISVKDNEHNPTK
jgi:hypothetical protein